MDSNDKKHSCRVCRGSDSHSIPDVEGDNGNKEAEEPVMEAVTDQLGAVPETKTCITDSEDEHADTGDLKGPSSSFLTISHTSTSSREDEEPEAKRRRPLEELDTTERLFEQKLAALIASCDDGDSFQSEQSHHNYSSSDGGSENVECGSLGAQLDFNINESTSNEVIQSAQQSQTPGRSRGLFRDISDVTSLSSISISSNEICSFEPGRQNDQIQTHAVCEQWEWHSPIQSDDDWAAPSPPPFDVEFEVASVSINSSNPIEDANSSSGLEDEGIDNVHMKDTDSSDSLSDETENDADEEWEKDKSDDEESLKNVGGVSDSELSDKDFWHCTQCHAKTNSPYLRYCLRCFRIRRNWLPKRPQPKHNGKKLARQENRNRSRSRNLRHTSSEAEGEAEVDRTHPDPSATETVQIQNTENRCDPLSSSGRSTTAATNSPYFSPNINRTPEPGDVDVVDSSTGPKSSSTGGPSSGSSNLRPASSAYSNTSTEGTCDWDCTDGHGPRPRSASMPPPPPSQSETVSAQLLKDVLTRKPIKIKSIRKSTSYSEEKESPVCSVCMVRDKDAAFVHGKTAHVYSCYQCADKILKKNGKCPICRKRILRVVKVINS